MFNVKFDTYIKEDPKKKIAWEKLKINLIFQLQHFRLCKIGLLLQLKYICEAERNA